MLISTANISLRYPNLYFLPIAYTEPLHGALYNYETSLCSLKSSTEDKDIQKDLKMCGTMLLHCNMVPHNLLFLSVAEALLPVIGHESFFIYGNFK